MNIIDSIKRIFAPAVILTPLEGRVYKTKQEVITAFHAYKLFNPAINGRIHRGRFLNKANFRDQHVLLSYGPNNSQRELVRN